MEGGREGGREKDQNGSRVSIITNLSLWADAIFNRTRVMLSSEVVPPLVHVHVVYVNCWTECRLIQRNVRFKADSGGHPLVLSCILYFPQAGNIVSMAPCSVRDHIPVWNINLSTACHVQKIHCIMQK